MRMTAAGVVCWDKIMMWDLLLTETGLDHGAVRHVCACEKSEVSYLLGGPTPQYLELTSLLRLAPVDAILTRMGAYDNMFSNASTFKVEMDEWYVRVSHHAIRYRA
jgi:hypothetical protein